MMLACEAHGHWHGRKVLPAPTTGVYRSGGAYMPENPPGKEQFNVLPEWDSSEP
jgi:hypothetical protein